MARKTNYTCIFQLDPHAISVLRCRLSGGKPVETSWLRQTGNWPDAEAVSGALRDLIQKNGLKEDAAYLVLPRHDVTTRFLTLPSHDMNEIAGMVRFSAEEYVPYSLEELIIDQWVLNPLESGESHVLAALAHHEVVEKHIGALASAGISPERVMLSTACLAATADACPAQGAFALVNLVSGGIEIAVFEKKVPVFSRGIATAQDWASICANPEAGSSLNVLDTSGAEELASELRGSLSAYRRESADGLGADDVYVACAHADVGRLCAFLSEKTGKNCVPADFALDYLDKAGAAALPGIPLDCIGALREITGASPVSLNLLPVSETKARRIKGARRLALRAAVFAALILAALGGLYFQMLQQRQQLIRELQVRVEQLEPKARGITEKREALNILSRQVDRKGSIIEQIARVVESAPEGQVNFSRLSLHREEGINLWGRAKTVTDVAQFTQNIRSLAEGQLEFFARARSLYEQQTLERDIPVFAYEIEVSAEEEEEQKEEAKSNEN